MKKRFTEAQIVGFLWEADAGVAIKDLCLQQFPQVSIAHKLAALLTRLEQGPSIVRRWTERMAISALSKADESRLPLEPAFT